MTDFQRTKPAACTTEYATLDTGDLPTHFGEDPKKIVLSVAFGAGAGTKWSPMGIDFLVRIQARDKFEVAPFGEAVRFFKTAVSGLTQLPEVWMLE